MATDCDPREVALKSFFLGPQAENSLWFQDEIIEVLKSYYAWRASKFPHDGCAISTADMESEGFKQQRKKVAKHLSELLRRFGQEVPKFSPRYIGHMVSEISLPAFLGHISALLHNPNILSTDVARVGSQIEREAIEDLLEMLGFDRKIGDGHFTSGGTVANIEALWRARFRADHWLSLGAFEKSQGNTTLTLFELAHRGWKNYEQKFLQLNASHDTLKKYSMVANNPWSASRTFEELFSMQFKGPVVLAPASKHYSWPKAVSLMGIGEEAFWPIELDEEGRLCIDDLKEKIELARKEGRPVLMVVSVAGTTELGEIDPINRVQELLDEYKQHSNLHIWHHVDAAYGGYFCSLLRGNDTSLMLSTETMNSLKAIAQVDSVTIDPHKLGYVPYACGAILVPNSENYQVSSFAAPYVTKEDGGNKWLSTLEGSRGASGAAATWLTSKCLGLNYAGYGTILERTIENKRLLEKALIKNYKNAHPVPSCDTNVLCFCMAKKEEKLSATNYRTTKICKQLPLSDQPFYVSKTILSFRHCEKFLSHFLNSWNGVRDTDELVLIRIVLMNPFFSSKETSTDFISAFITGNNALFDMN